MTTKPLRSVQPGETAPARRKRKPTVAQAAATGDQLAYLIASRDRIAVTITDPKCPPTALAALTKRLDDTFEKIKTLMVQQSEGDEDHDEDVDETFDASAI